MRRISSALSTSYSNLSSATSGAYNAVLDAPSNIGNAVISKMGEDTDLAEFEYPMFGEESLCFRLDSDFSIDSGVVTEQDSKMDEISVLEQMDTPIPADRGDTSRSVSSISVSSEEDFLGGLDFDRLDTPYLDNVRDASPKSEATHDITRVTSDILSSSDDSEFDLDITATEVFLARQRNISADSRRARRTQSLNHSGNLSLRKSFNELDLKRSSSNKLSASGSSNLGSSNSNLNTSLSKSNLTLSNTSTPQNSSTVPSSKSRSDSTTLNTIQKNVYYPVSPRPAQPSIKEERKEPQEDEFELPPLPDSEDDELDEKTALQLNNFLELSQQDPTTIESFDYSSLNEKLKAKNVLSQGSTRCDTLSDFDEDEDLLERKDPFRESFLCGNGANLKDTFEIEVQTSPKAIPDPCSFIKAHDKLVNRDSGQINRIQTPSPNPFLDKTNDDVITTISEISVRSVSKADRNCTISRQAPVNFKPLPKIQAISSKPKGSDSFKSKSNVLYKSSGKSASISNLSVTPIKSNTKLKKQPSNISSSTTNLSKTNLSSSNSNLSKTAPGKRKNILTPPSSQPKPKPAAKPSPIKTSYENTPSPRSVSQSCYNLNSKTDQISLNGTLDNIQTLDNSNFTSAEILTRSGTEIITRSGTLDGFNSLDKTKSCADITFTPQQFSTESSPTDDIPENSNSSTDGSSTFYSFSTSSEEVAPADPKSSKSFMFNMRTSFKRLANFLSLSGNKGPVKKKDSPSGMQPSPSMVSVYNILPSPPPAGTKPCSPTVRTRHGVRPLSPSGVSEFTQISKSCSNVGRNAIPQHLHPVADVDRGSDTLSNLSFDDLNSPGSTPGSNQSHPNLSTSTSGRKKISPPSTLINHINAHYTDRPTPSTKRTSYTYGVSTPQLAQKFSKPSNNYSKPARNPGLSTPQLSRPSRVRQSSEILSGSQNIMPQPPAGKRPQVRETKASRLRLNKLKAPSMSSLQF